MRWLTTLLIPVTAYTQCPEQPATPVLSVNLTYTAPQSLGQTFGLGAGYILPLVPHVFYVGIGAEAQRSVKSGQQLVNRFTPDTVSWYLPLTVRFQLVPGTGQNRPVFFVHPGWLPNKDSYLSVGAGYAFYRGMFTLSWDQYTMKQEETQSITRGGLAFRFTVLFPQGN